MEATRLAPTVGIVASLAVLAVLAVPYVLVDAGRAVAVYYAAGDTNPLALALFAVVAVIVFAAGREHRSEPDLVAGAALVLGMFMLAIATLWAVTVPVGVVTQMSTAAVLEYHRHALVLTSLVVPASAAWYARALGIF